MLKLQSECIGLVRDDPGGPESWSGRHTEHGVSRPLSHLSRHAVEAGVLHGCVSALLHVGLGRSVLLLAVHGWLLIHHHTRVLTGELILLHRLGLNTWMRIQLHFNKQ